ncbi:MAG: hypothetical protein ACTIH2_00045 [Anaerococcus sp.]
MRSILKFLFLTFVIIFIPTVVMLIISTFGSTTIFLFIGQAIVILALMGFFLVYLKKERAYEKDTLDKIEHENDLVKLRELRDEKISYKSKAEITKKILSLEYSEKEMKLLKKYAVKKEDMDFYYAKLIKENRDKREENKLRRDNFNKRYAKKRYVYVDFKEVFITAIKWTLVFAVFSGLAISKIHYKLFDPYIAYAIAMILFIISAFLTINTIIWIIRAMKAYWIKEYI